MSIRPSQHQRSFSQQGFQPLEYSSEGSMPPQNATYDIPLQTVVSHSPSNRGAASGYNVGNESDETAAEKDSGLFHRGRRLKKVNSKGQPAALGDTEEKTYLNRMGRLYEKVLQFSIFTRYLIYILPLAACFAVPIIIGATAAPYARIGKVPLVWFFTWIEIVWVGIWISKIVAHSLPTVFAFFMGVVSAGVRKYALVLRSLEIPLSLVGWGLVALTTFEPVTVIIPENRNELDAEQHWQSVVKQILVAALVSACIFLGEKTFIQLISINYHRKQFDARIKDSKRNINLLCLLYDASRTLFPMYCNEFAEEDYIITDVINLNLGKKKGRAHARSGSVTPMRLLQDMHRVGDKVTSMFGNVAQEITGKRVFDVNSAHTIVTQALEKNRSAEALARRIWMSFVVEGRNTLSHEDIVEVLGPEHQVEAEEAFAALDRDGNGDVSLDEMILTVTEFGRERKSIATSMHDVDQAINVLDSLLNGVVFVVCIFVFVSFLNSSFTTTLATAGTTLISLSFIFSVTCQEVLGSCIFIFVKHPYDVGDRVDIGNDQLTVEHTSLLFTVFKRSMTGKLVQIPNNVLNSLWIENVSRSKAMREQISLYVAFDTTFEDIKLLKEEMTKFVRDKENCRDFQPDVDIEVLGINEMDKLELRIEIRHKSNWANESVRAMRRSKFMCALVIAIRKIPIYAPGGGGPGLGEAANPNYSVAISPEQAEENKDKAAKARAAAHMVTDAPKSTSPAEANEAGKSSGADYLSASVSKPENVAVHDVVNRNLAVDPTRDAAWAARGDDSSSIGRHSVSDQKDYDEVRSLLHKTASQGKRRAGTARSPSPNRAVPYINQPGPAYEYEQHQQMQQQQMQQQQMQQQQMQQQQSAAMMTPASPSDGGLYPGRRQSLRPNVARIPTGSMMDSASPATDGLYPDVARIPTGDVRDTSSRTHAQGNAFASQRYRETNDDEDRQWL